MDVVGHGVDIQDISFFARLGESATRDLLAAYFTDSELAHAGDGPNRGAHLAGRYAAKEAVLKALGTRLTGEATPADIEIRALASGAPSVSLHGPCAELAAALGIQRWVLSISHSDSTAVASVLALGVPGSASSC